MRRALFALVCGLMLAAFAAPALAEWPHDPTAVGVRFSNRSAMYPISCPDGSGGTFIAFLDLTTQHVWVQHVSASGALLWGSFGVQAGGNTAYWPESIVPDGSGGCFVSWFLWVSNNYDVYVQHVSSAGTTLWNSNGVVVCNAANNQAYSVLVADPAFGGLFVAWLDERAAVGNQDIYLQYLNSSGVAQLTANGIPVCTAAGNQSKLGMVSDGSYGAILSWLDSRGTYPTPYVSRVLYNGAVSWGANGAALTVGVNADAYNPVIVPDGRNGAIVGWYDWRNGNSDVYAQRLSNSGTILWTNNGVPVTSLAADQVNVAMASDGAGGAVFAWIDSRNGNSDVYAQRVAVGGTASWTTNGVAVCTAAGTQANVRIAGDGSGGAVIAWTDSRALSDADIYAQRVTAAGGVSWTADGVAVCTMPNSQSDPSVAPDGAGGVLVNYIHPNYNGYTARVDRFGILGGAEPSITSIRDVPNDEGGYVSIRWNKSWLDVMPGNPISQYWIWRQVPQAAAQAALAKGATLLDAGETPQRGARTLRAIGNGLDVYYWEYLGYVSAQGQAGYSVIEPTRGDSVAGSNPRTLFMIEARYAAVTGEYWDSAPDSGYSVDNLAPAMPAPFTGAYENGLVVLQWGASTASDFAEYRLYRGSSSTFEPGPSTLVGYFIDPSYADSPRVPRWYKVVAVDVHGNVSEPATLLPTGTLGVDDVPAFALAFAPPSPNPTHGRANFAFTLPAAGQARLALFDAAGRQVREVAAGAFAPGAHHIDAELTDAAGHPLPAGLYLARLEAAGRTLVRRLAVVR